MGLQIRGTSVGQWVTLSLSGFTAKAGFGTPAYRVEGDRVWFKGEMTADSAYTAGTTFATMPTALTPPESRRMSNRGQTGQNNVLVNASGGVVSFSVNITSGHWVSLDGLSYTLT